MKLKTHQFFYQELMACKIVTSLDKKLGHSDEQSFVYIVPLTDIYVLYKDLRFAEIKECTFLVIKSPLLIPI